MSKLAEKIRKVSCWKHTPLFQMLEKIKLWPSRQGVLHGVKTFEASSESYAYILTHCGEKILVRNSKNSRAARWLRNKWYIKNCEKCAIPEWKINKYAATVFKQGRIPVFIEKQRKENIKL